MLTPDDLDEFVQELIEAQHPDQSLQPHSWHDEDIAEDRAVVLGRLSNPYKLDDILAESNYHSALALLREADEEHVHEGHLSHWATNLDLITVDIYDDTGEYTDAIKLAHEIYLGLDDYPIIDEEDFSEREYNDAIRYLEDYCFTWSDTVELHIDTAKLIEIDLEDHDESGFAEYEIKELLDVLHIDSASILAGLNTYSSDEIDDNEAVEVARGLIYEAIGHIRRRAYVGDDQLVME